MTKFEQYKKAVSSAAYRIINSETPEATQSSYIMDITGRTEKGFINKLKAELLRDIDSMKGFGMDTRKYEKMVQILDTRLEVLAK